MKLKSVIASAWMMALITILMPLTGCTTQSSSSQSSDTNTTSGESAQSSEQNPDEGDVFDYDLPPLKALPEELEISDAQAFAEEVQAMFEGTGEYADNPVAVIRTNKGTIKVRLFPEYAPKAVENFVTHAKSGYYNNLVFHRISKDFVIQGGDPTATGTGGASIWGQPFEDEFDDVLHHFRGALSMANSGANTNTSQFFIVQKEDAFDSAPAANQISTMFYNRTQFNGRAALFSKIESGMKEEDVEKLLDEVNTEFAAKIEAGVTDEFYNNATTVMNVYSEKGGTPFLDYKHTVFGYVFEGMDVVDKINQLETDQNEKPVEDVEILEVIINEPANS